MAHVLCTLSSRRPHQRSPMHPLAISVGRLAAAVRWFMRRRALLPPLLLLLLLILSAHRPIYLIDSNLHTNAFLPPVFVGGATPPLLSSPPLPFPSSIPPFPAPLLCSTKLPCLVHQSLSLGCGTTRRQCVGLFSTPGAREDKRYKRTKPHKRHHTESRNFLRGPAPLCIWLG